MAKNPLFDALKSRSAIQVSEFRPLPAPRLVDFKPDEIGKVMPGDVVKIMVSGVIKSVSDESVMVNVTKAENCMDEEDDNDEAEEEGMSKIVTTQESHVP